MVLVLAACGTPDQSAAGAEQTGFNSSSIGGSMMVRRLGTVIYHVADLHRATTWYTQAFQQEPYFDEPFYIGFNIGGYELGLDSDFTLSRPGAGPNSRGVCVLARDCAAKSVSYSSAVDRWC